jgi:uncharacterized protein
MLTCAGGRAKAHWVAMHKLPEMNDGRLYDRLEALGEQARASVHLLVHAEEGAMTPAALSESVEKSATIAREIEAHLVHAVVASLPKADIEALSRILAAIPPAAERFASRSSLAADNLAGLGLGQPLSWLEESCEIVLDMIRQLRGFESLDRIKDLYPRLQTVVEQAETLTDAVVTQAYQKPATPLSAILAKDLGACLQEIVDRCRDAGELMYRISGDYL